MKENRLESRILNALIYLASKEGKNKIPTIKEFILSEIVAATIEYLTGKEHLFTYDRTEEGQEIMAPASSWEWKTNDKMKAAIAESGEKLPEPLREAIKEMTYLNSSFDEWGDQGYNCFVYFFYGEFICRSHSVSTFRPHPEFVKKVRKEILSLDPAILAHCKSIAGLMEKYIQKDLELIGRRYHW